jgi:S1-C subfamily serine protease
MILQLIQTDHDLPFAVKSLALLFAIGVLPLEAAGPEPVDDATLRRTFARALGKLAETEDHPTGEAIAGAVAKAPARHRPRVEDAPATDPPKNPEDGVFLIGSVYQCGKCDDWHLRGEATAWAVTRGGVMCTNHHVLEKARGAVLGVCDRGGRVYPLTEVLAADPGHDVVLFRVAADDLTPLPLGPVADIGAEIEVISHPYRRFFTHTYGRVSRYFQARKADDEEPATRMAITADYAKGSSGGPLLDAAGRVVGMVSSTESIYYGSRNGQPKGPLQMVLKHCVPGAAIHALLGQDPPGTPPKSRE